MPEADKRAHQDDAAGVIHTRDLDLEWAEAPWDTAVFGFPVLQITRIEVHGPAADSALSAFEVVRDKLGAGLVSCRLPHDHLKESMLLEAHGFRFIEMVYQPEMDDLQTRIQNAESGLTVARAKQEQLPLLLDIAGTAFRNERFHMDPRVDPGVGDQRYRNWVMSSFNHPRQQLYVLRDGCRLVAFFVTEMLPDGTCYWHLNAVAPQVQGQGYGKRAWLAMLHQAREAGARRVRTCIVARNHRVLNLYARLGFRFPPPLMTFHWVRERP